MNWAFKLRFIHWLCFNIYILQKYLLIPISLKAISYICMLGACDPY